MYKSRSITNANTGIIWARKEINVMRIGSNICEMRIFWRMLTQIIIVFKARVCYPHQFLELAPSDGYWKSASNHDDSVVDLCHCSILDWSIWHTSCRSCWPTIEPFHITVLPLCSFLPLHGIPQNPGRIAASQDFLVKVKMAPNSSVRYLICFFLINYISAVIFSDEKSQNFLYMNIVCKRMNPSSSK